MLTQAQYLAAIERDSASFGEIIESADLALDVPDCPGWTLLDLIKHVGGVHRWAHGVIVSGAPIDVPPGPDDPVSLTRWFADGSAQLVDLLRTTDPDAPAWTFGPPPRVVSFWSRRQAHETAMHLVDASHTLGIPAPMDAAFAADGVDEVVSMFFPRQVHKGRLEPLVPGIRITVDENPDVAFVLAGDGTDPTAPTAALIAGPAEIVLQVLWGRASLDELQVEGNHAVATKVLQSAITP